MIKVLFICHGRTLGLLAILGIMGHNSVSIKLKDYRETTFFLL